MFSASSSENRGQVSVNAKQSDKEMHSIQKIKHNRELSYRGRLLPPRHCCHEVHYTCH